jgi:hypothetical protein
VHENAITFGDLTDIFVHQAAGGRAIAFKVNTPGGVELRYVDLRNPGQSRLVHGPVPANELGWVNVSRDGRFVVFEVISPVAGHRQLHVLDRDSAAAAQRLSLPDVDQAYAKIGVFNQEGTAMYYAGHREPAQPWVSAMFRADLATRQVTRVSPESSLHTHDLVYPLPDDSGYVDMRISGNRLNTWLTRNNNPAGETPLVDSVGLMNTFFPAALSDDGRHFFFIERNASNITVGPRLARTDNPGASTEILLPGPGSIGFYGLPSLRRDSLGMVLGMEGFSPAAIYEVLFADPANPTPVFSSTDSSMSVTAYTADAERISYVRSFNDSTAALAVTRRGSFGQSTRLTPVGDRVITYRTDPTGYVALTSVQGTPGRAVLVNLDLPLMTLPIGTTGVNFSQFAVVPR